MASSKDGTHPAVAKDMSKERQPLSGAGENERKKVLVIDSSAGPGGGQRIAFDICSKLSERFDQVVASPKGPYNEKYASIGVPIHILPDGFPAGEINRIVRDEKPDIIHAHGTRAAMWARASKAFWGNRQPLVYTLHGLHIAKRPFPKKQALLFLERAMNRWTDALVCVSDDDRAEVLRYGLIDPKKLGVIKNGIDVDAFQASAKGAGQIRKSLAPEGRTVICSVGRLHPQKDFSTLLKALKEVNGNERGYYLLIAGDGPLRKPLEKEAEGLGIAQDVKFLGFREDVAAIMAASDIVVLSSNWEAFGLVCIEAGAVERPIIASDIEGVREAVKDGVTGYLFKKGDPMDLAEKIRLLSSKECRDRLGHAGYEYALNNYDSKRMASEYAKLYDSIKSPQQAAGYSR